MVFDGKNLELGLGGMFEAGPPEGGERLEWLGSRVDHPKVAAIPIEKRLEYVISEMEKVDPSAKIEFLETGALTADEAAAAAKAGIPVKQFTDVYVLKGFVDDAKPPALTLLKKNLEIAKSYKTVEKLNMQIWGDDITPTNEELREFYTAALRLAKPYGIKLYTETHIDRYTYDPRRLIAVHEDLLKHKVNGTVGLEVNADFSHYVHQINNPTALTYRDQQSGALVLDPTKPDEDYVIQNIINAGLCGYGHMRCAIPNNLGRGYGSIQYPIVNPRVPMKFHKKFDECKTETFKNYYRALFRFQMSHPERPVMRISTEFIQYEDQYRVDDYSNLHQNLACLAWAQATKREILEELNSTEAVGKKRKASDPTSPVKKGKGSPKKSPMKASPKKSSSPKKTSPKKKGSK